MGTLPQVSAVGVPPSQMGGRRKPLQILRLERRLLSGIAGTVPPKPAMRRRIGSLAKAQDTSIDDAGCAWPHPRASWRALIDAAGHFTPFSAELLQSTAAPSQLPG
jgi:hypothetical protein